MGSLGTSPMEAPHPLGAGAPLKPRELARSPLCRETQQKFWIRRWRAEGGKASKEVGMGGKRTLAVWEGERVIRIAGCQHLPPAGSRGEPQAGATEHVVPCEAAPLAAPGISRSDAGVAA